MREHCRTIVICILCAVFCMSLSAQTSVLSIGVNGGGQTWLPSTAKGAPKDVKGGIGFAGSLNLRYTFYGHPAEGIDLGFAIGGGVGYGFSDIRGTHTDAFTNTDYNGLQMDYAATGVFRQTDRFMKAEASLLFAMRFGQVTLNVGPRFLLPFSSSRTFTLREATIDAYYPLFNVHVVNEVVTGYIQTPYVRKEASTLPQYNLLMTLEIGYEWPIKEQHSIGVQAYADFGVWNNYANTVAATPLISVAPITDAKSPEPAVTVGSPEQWLTGRRYLDFGIRLYYAFSTDTDTQHRRANPTPSRDTRHHHNRYLWH